MDSLISEEALLLAKYLRNDEGRVDSENTNTLMCISQEILTHETSVFGQEIFTKTVLSTAASINNGNNVRIVVALLLVLALLSVSCLALPFLVNAEPRTIVVPDDAQTITAALNYALNGETILVKKGTYTQDTIVIDKAVKLIGEDANSTILRHTALPPWNGQYPLPPGATTVQINTNLAVVSNFTITNFGTAIAISGYLNRIANNIIAEGDGGIVITGSNNTISQNLILKNNVALSCSGSCNNITDNNIVGSFPEGLRLEGPSNTVYANLMRDTPIDVASDLNIIAKNNITGSGIDIERGSNNLVYANRVVDGGGLLLGRGYNNIFTANYLANNTYGARIGSPYPERGDSNSVYHNNFIGNIEQVRTDYTVYGRDFWDKDGEGNYWSDYTGSDANRDGIGDTPYVIDEMRRDNFPLMFPWGPWDIVLSSPENRSYSGSVPLVFVADRPAEWFGYSIDGLSNVTVSGNATISGLAEGWHTVTVYANDTLGNAGTSETISFLVDTQTPLFQTLLAAVAVVAAAVVAGAGLLLCRRKRHGSSNPP